LAEERQKDETAAKEKTQENIDKVKTGTKKEQKQA